MSAVDAPHDDLIMAQVALLPEAEQARALGALRAFLDHANRMIRARLRGVEVAPLWRDPTTAMEAEAARLEELGDMAAVVFSALAESRRLRDAVEAMEYAR